jgi:hypothetical protein
MFIPQHGYVLMVETPFCDARLNPFSFDVDETTPIFKA